MDAADRVANGRGQSLSLPRETRRKEPLGQATSSPTEHHRYDRYIFIDSWANKLHYRRLVFKYVRF